MRNAIKERWLNIVLLCKLEYLVRPIGFLSFTAPQMNKLFNPITGQYKTEIAERIYYLFSNPLGLKPLRVHVDNIIIDDVVRHFRSTINQSLSDIELLDLIEDKNNL